MKGRIPKPQETHEINGNPGKRPRNRTAPAAPVGIPEPYDFLTDEVKAEWRFFGEILHKQMRILTMAHGPLLQELAENRVEIRQLRAEIEKDGRFQKIRMTNGSKRQVVRPAVLALSDAEKRYRALLEQCGLTPVAESRVNAKAPEENKNNAAAKYFNRGKVIPIRTD